MNWENMFFIEKMELWTHWTYSRIFDFEKGPANTFPFYLQILIMEISTQTDNHKSQKVVAAIKSAVLKKMI